VAASLPETTISDLSVRTFVTPSSSETKITSDRTPSELSLLRRSPPASTSPSLNELKDRLAIGLERPERQSSLAVQVGAKTVEGVIGDLLEETVVVHCRLPTGMLDIRLPKTVVPSELLRYGAPVSVSLRSERGARYPVIEPRERNALDALEGEAEIDDWIKSL
jgi:hypothetical protein